MNGVLSAELRMDSIPTHVEIVATSFGTPLPYFRELRIAGNTFSVSVIAANSRYASVSMPYSAIRPCSSK